MTESLSTNPTAYPNFQYDIHYPPPPGSAQTRLHTLDICFPAPLPPSAPSQHQIWVIFIHGGAWRDPNITSRFALPAIMNFISTPQASSSPHHILAYTSLNYRLSPYPPSADPALPLAPASTSTPELLPTLPARDTSRQVAHPEHIHDILAALTHLQTLYPSSRNYLLVGHSCGATLALQSIMRSWGPPPLAPVKAVGVCGVEGIYDLEMLVHHHGDTGVYREIVEGAFGRREEGGWADASPRVVLEKQLMGGLGWVWEEGRVLLLAHSEEDELVEREQVLQMWEVVRRDGNRVSRRTDELMWIEGKHDQVWEEGVELARVVRRALELMGIRLI